MKLFEDAKGQHNVILVLERGHNENYPIESIITHRTGMGNNRIMNIILSGNDLESEYFSFEQKDLYDGEESLIRLSGCSSNESNVDYTNLILEKIQKNNESLKSICFVNAGIGVTISKINKTYLNDYSELKLKKGQGVFVVSPTESKDLETSIIKDFVKNSNIEHYVYQKNKDKLIYLTWDDDIENYPNIKQYLSQFKQLLVDQGLACEETFPWYALNRPRTKDVFEEENKIILPYRSKSNNFAYSNEPIYGSRDVIFIRKNNDAFKIKYLLALLNSKLYYFWLYHRGKRKGETLELYPNSIKRIPIKEITIKLQEPFIEESDKMIFLQSELMRETNGFKDWLMDTFVINIPQKLDRYYELSFEAFLNEVSKKKVNVKARDNYQVLKEEFEKSITKINPLLLQIKETNNEIDQMVYDLYGLTQEEIKIIDESLIND